MNGEEIKKHLLQWGIEPSSILHYEKQVVMLHFSKDITIIAIIKQHEGRWSKTLNSWYIPKSKKLLIKIVACCRNKRY